ncbi:uncharacterized protein LOC131941465 [Physella acuta]|uniref:uncharacterized protein LOC131941465 n=1 Tax=Physella acuta TaxID=109671 RepID=UPI0027DDED6E|nr:uncharacterized protein LOC131941465 [Physella acuta]XP_059156726.1 uncharacterized protein LOC131941465 [Physella acuta]XP_059156727.1 uncharacterized protein LOC131941465 [Physella acuta]XP_059156728.1 uncharacterized protein LOC131941465 [Physella acuta]
MGQAASCGSRKVVANQSYDHHVTSYPAKDRMETRLTDTRSLDINMTYTRELDRDLTDTRELDRDMTYTRELDRDLTDTRELDRDMTYTRELDRDLTDTRELDINMTYTRELDRDLTDTRELDREKTDNRELDGDLTDTRELDRDLTDTRELDRDLTDTRELDRDLTDTKDSDRDLTDTRDSDRDMTDTRELGLGIDLTDTKLLGRHLRDERQLEDVRQVLHDSPHLMVTVQNILELTESESGELKADILSLSSNSRDRQLVEEVLNMTDFFKQTMAMFTSGHRQTDRQTDRLTCLQLWNILSGTLPSVIAELSAKDHLQHLSNDVIRWLRNDDEHPQPREQIETLKLLWGASQHPEGALWVPDLKMEAVLTGLLLKHQGQEELSTWLEILLTSGLDETRQQYTTAGYGVMDKMISQLRHPGESQAKHNVSTKVVLQVVAHLLNDEDMIERFDQKGGPGLIQTFLTSPDPEIQVCAAECLYQLGWNPDIWHRLMESEEVKHLLDSGFEGSLDPHMKDVCIRFKVLGKIHKPPVGEQTPALSTHFQPHVMLSYNWNVKDSIHRINENLSKNDIATWLDTKDMGDHLMDSMAEAVEKAYVVVIAATEKYQFSKNCKLEAKYAHHLNKRLIFVKLDSYKPTGWLGLLQSDLLYINFTKNFDDAMEQLITAIKNQREQNDAGHNKGATQVEPSTSARATEKLMAQTDTRGKSSPDTESYGDGSSTPISENSSARGSSTPISENSSARGSSTPISVNSSARGSSTPISENSSARGSSTPISENSSARGSSTPISVNSSARGSSTPISENSSARGSSTPISENSSARGSSTPISENSSARGSSTPISENSSARGSNFRSKQNTSMASVGQRGQVDHVKGHKNKQNGGQKDRTTRNQEKQERKSRRSSGHLVQVPRQSDGPVFNQPIYCPAYYFINWTIGSSKVDGCRKGCPECLLQQVNGRGHDPFSRYNVTHTTGQRPLQSL